MDNLFPNAIRASIERLAQKIRQQMPFELHDEAVDLLRQELNKNQGFERSILNAEIKKKIDDDDRQARYVVMINEPEQDYA
ncbi:MAG: hypothetical protein ACOCWM_01045 [Cyclobacteriaceae bacterium]